MYKSINKCYYFFDNKNGVEYIDPFIAQYTGKYLLRNKSISTVKKHITSIH